jgi:hypothetical protein
MQPVKKQSHRHPPLVRVRLRGFECVVNVRAALVVAALGAMLRLLQQLGH